MLDHLTLNSTISLSLSLCSNPTVCPPNLDDGPHTLICVMLLNNPFFMFSAASFVVEPIFRIIGSMDAFLPGSFV